MRDAQNGARSPFMKVHPEPVVSSDLGTAVHVHVTNGSPLNGQGPQKDGVAVGGATLAKYVDSSIIMTPGPDDGGSKLRGVSYDQSLEEGKKVSQRRPIRINRKDTIHKLERTKSGGGTKPLAGQPGSSEEGKKGNKRRSASWTSSMRRRLTVTKKPRSILRNKAGASGQREAGLTFGQAGVTSWATAAFKGRKRAQRKYEQHARAHRVRFTLGEDERKAPHVLGCLPVLPDDSKILRRWDLFMVLPLSYETFAIPLRLAITNPGYNGQMLADVITDGIFCVDIVFQLCTPYYDGLGYKVTSPGMILRRWLLKTFPRSFVPPLLMYLPIVLEMGKGWWWALSVLRLVRTLRLTEYFKAMGLNLDINVRELKVVQFILLLFLTTHWVGCTFFFLARLVDFDSSTWIYQVEDWELVHGFQVATASVAEKYALIMFKGINALTNIGYEGVMPDNPQEMLWTILIMFFQILVAAYILGTLFHYLVAKDAALEDYKAKLELLQTFMNDRKLPMDLRTRLIKYFQFRFSKSRRTYGTRVELPRSLQLRVVAMQYEGVMAACMTGRGAVLRGCNPQFMGYLLLRLNEVFLMPGEEFIHINDIARDLFFVLQGTVDIMDEKDKILHTVRGEVEAEGRTIVGDVGFFIGVLHPHKAAARDSTDATLLVLGKEVYNELVENYPEQHELIVCNILAEYGLDPKGEEIPTFSAMPEEEEEVERVRTLVGAAVKRRAEDLFGQLLYSVTMGDVEEVAMLLRKGVDPNTTDYDGRTVLHVAAMEGYYKVVDLLLDEGVDKNQVDRWDQTPLHLAVNQRQTQVVELLTQRGGKLQLSDPAGALCEAASTGDLEQCKRLIDNGINPNEGDYDQRTPLHLAAAVGGQKVVEYLINMGADTNVTDRWGGTPLTDAVNHGHVLVAHVIRSAGGLLPKGGEAKKLCEAASRGEVPRIRMLAECGVDLNAGDYDGRTALHLAAAEGRVLVVSLMLSMSANPNVQDRWSNYPLDDALRGSHSVCARLLESAGGRYTDRGEDTREAVAGMQSTSMDDARRRIAEMQAMGLDRAATTMGGEREQLARRLAVSRSVVMMGQVGEMFEAVARCLGELGDSLLEPCRDLPRHLVALNVLGRRKGQISITAGYQSSLRSVERRVSASNTKRWKESKNKLRLLGEGVGGLGGFKKAGGAALSNLFGQVMNQARPGKESPSAFASALVAGPEPHGNGTSPQAAAPAAPRRPSLTPAGAEPPHENGIGGGGDAHAATTPDGVPLNLYEDLDNARALSRAASKNGGATPAELRAMTRDLVRDVDRDRARAFHEIVVSNVEILQSGYDVLRACFEPFQGPDRRVAAEDLPGVLHLIGLHASQDQADSIVAEAWGAAAYPESLEEAIELAGGGAEEGKREQRMDELTNSVTMNGLWSCSSTFKMLLDDAVPAEDAILPPDSVARYEEMVDLAAEFLDGVDEGGGSHEKLHSDPIPPDVEEAFLQLVARASSVVEHCLMSFASDHDDPTVPTSTLHAIRPHVSEAGLLLFEQLFVARELDEILSPSAFCMCFSHWLSTPMPVPGDDDADAAGDGDAGCLTRAARHLAGRGSVLLRIPVPTSHLLKSLFDHDVLPRYEAAFVGATGSALHPMRPHELPAFLHRLLPRYRIVESQVAAVLACFDRDGDGQITLPEMVRTLKARVQESAEAARSGSETSKWHDGIVLMPHLRMWAVWDTLVRILSVYNFVIIPIQVAFKKLHADDGVISSIDLACDSAFVLEVLLRFIRAYVNPSLVAVTDLKLIYVHYASTNLVVDLIAAFPFDHIALGASGQTKAWLRLPKLMRMRLVYQHWKATQKNVDAQTVGAGVKRLLYITISMVHVFACAFYYLGSRGDDQWVPRMAGWYGGGEQSDVPDSYLLSFYFVMATFTTNGLVGDLLPRNFEELLFATVLEFVHMTLYAYILGEISGLVMRQDDLIAEQRAQKATVDNFIASKGGLSDDLRTDIRKHYASASSRLDMSEVYGLMSHSLRVEVAQNISRTLLDDVSLFRNCSESFLDHIAVMMGEAHVSPGDEVFHTNDPSSELYIVSGGVAERLLEVPGEQAVVEGVVRPGGCIGEIGFFFGMRHVFTARAAGSEMLVLFVLKRESFQSLLKMYPDEESAIATNAINGYDRVAKSIKTMSDTGSHAQSEGAADHFQLVVGSAIRQTIDSLKKRRRADAVERFLIAASKGRLVDAKREVMSVSVNARNADGRTALMVAAAEGRLEMVRELMAMGADVSAVDRHGNSCLNDAVRHDHREVAALLLASGAVLKMSSFESAVIMCAAASKNDIPTLRRWVESGVKPSVADYDSRTALHLACSNGHLEAAEYLLSVGADINARDRWDGTPLVDAVRHGHTDVQKALRDRGTTLSGGFFASRMCELAAEGDVDEIKVLVLNGVDPGVADYDGRTALHLAACEERMAVVELLLDLQDTYGKFRNASMAGLEFPLRHDAQPDGDNNRPDEGGRVRAVPRVGAKAASAAAAGLLSGTPGGGADDDGPPPLEAVALGGLPPITSSAAAPELPWEGVGLGGDDWEAELGLKVVEPTEEEAAMLRRLQRPAGKGAGGKVRRGSWEADLRRFSGIRHAISPEMRNMMFVNPVDRMGGTPLDDASRGGRDVMKLWLMKRGGLPGGHEDVSDIAGALKYERDTLMRRDADRVVDSIILQCREHELLGEVEKLRDQVEAGMRSVSAIARRITSACRSVIAGTSEWDTTLGPKGGRMGEPSVPLAVRELHEGVASFLELRAHTCLTTPHLRRFAPAVVGVLDAVEPRLSAMADVASCLELMLEGLEGA